MISRLLLAFSCCVGSSAAFGQSQGTFSGNDWLPHCKRAAELRATDAKAMYCFGAIVTMVRLEPFFDAGYSFCVPDEVSNNQVVRVIVKFMEDNPTLLHRDFVLISLLGIQQAWPCKK